MKNNFHSFLIQKNCLQDWKFFTANNSIPDYNFPSQFQCHTQKGSTFDNTDRNSDEIPLNSCMEYSCQKWRSLEDWVTATRHASHVMRVGMNEFSLIVFVVVERKIKEKESNRNKKSVSIFITMWNIVLREWEGASFALAMFILWYCVEVKYVHTE